MYQIEILESRVLFAKGLTVTFFDGKNFGGDTHSEPVDRIDEDFGSGSPAPGIAPTSWSARWTGQIRPTESEEFTFTVRADQRVRLWVGGELLIDHWKTTDFSDQTHSENINLIAGRRYDLRLDYRHASGDAFARLSWRRDRQPKEIVPKSNLYRYDTRFAAIGDFGDSAKPFVEDVARSIDQLAPDFVITTGDNNYGTAGEYDLNIGQYFHQYIKNYQGDYGDGSDTGRFFPVLGNHEYESNPKLNAYFDFFDLPGNERYYTVTRGPVKLFFINSNPEEPHRLQTDEKQAQWLRRKLANSDAEWNIVVGHHPPYSSSNVHGSTDALQWPYQEWGADAILTGHDHMYERIERDEFTYFVNGSGGRSLYDFGPLVSGSQAQYNDDYGAMLVQANASSVTYQFINRKNEIIDTYTVTGTADNLVSGGSTWNYLDDGSDQGNDWRKRIFDDSDWQSGRGQLGYGQGDEVTPIDFGNDADNKPITTYFRHEFDVSDPDDIEELLLKLVYDDGAVVYLNDKEIFRVGMPGGEVNFDTEAAGGSASEVFIGEEIDPSLLRNGSNVLAVEVHQVGPTSSDISFDLALIAVNQKTTEHSNS